MTNKIKLKEVVPYLFLIILSFFVGSFILERFLGLGLERSAYLPILITGIVTYGIYVTIHPILKRILPVHIYKENKIVKLTTFFLIFIVGFIVFPILYTFIIFTFFITWL